MTKTRLLISYFVLVVLGGFAVVLSLMTGSVNISLTDFLGAIKGEGDEMFRDIVFTVRFPRAMGAYFSGAALALSGYSLQSFFHNPLAGPYLLGISHGAKLMVALLFVFFAGGSVGLIAMTSAAFIGALIATGFVLLCSLRVRSMAMLLVCGIMTGYICSAVTDLIVAFAQDADIVNLHNWSKGSLSGINSAEAFFMMAVILVCLLLLFYLSKPLSAYLGGEQYARSVGVNIKVLRVLLIVLSSILSATVTAFAGPVSFVGIAVPQLLKNLLRTEKPIVLIPACFLGGGVFCVFCDLIARMLFNPTELSISTVTAFFGAPVVIFMMVKRRREKEYE